MQFFAFMEAFHNNGETNARLIALRQLLRAILAGTATRDQFKAETRAAVVRRRGQDYDAGNKMYSLMFHVLMRRMREQHDDLYLLIPACWESTALDAQETLVSLSAKGDIIEFLIDKNRETTKYWPAFVREPRLEQSRLMRLIEDQYLGYSKLCYLGMQAPRVTSA